MANEANLLPKEHGAYAELVFPLLTGLALATPSVPALALGSAVIAFFLANEPVAILQGTRGRRLKDQLGRRARKRGLFLIGAGLLFGAAGVLGAGSSVWPVILLPALTGILLIPLVSSRRHKSVVGELLVVTTFSTLILPLSAASGADLARAIPAAAMWWVSFALGTLEVHAIKARAKAARKNGWTRWGSPMASGLALALAVAVVWRGIDEIPQASAAAASGVPAGGTPALRGISPHVAPAALGLMVPAAVTLVLALIRVHPRHLKEVGWTLVAANALALLILLTG
jgi:hypothetical protein